MCRLNSHDFPSKIKRGITTFGLRSAAKKIVAMCCFTIINAKVVFEVEFEGELGEGVIRGEKSCKTVEQLQVAPCLSASLASCLRLTSRSPTLVPTPVAHRPVPQPSPSMLSAAHQGMVLILIKECSKRAIWAGSLLTLDGSGHWRCRQETRLPIDRLPLLLASCCLHNTKQPRPLLGSTIIENFMSAPKMMKKCPKHVCILYGGPKVYIMVFRVQ